MSGYYSRNHLMDDWQADATASALAAHDRACQEASDFTRNIPASTECNDLWQRAYEEYLADAEFSEETSYWADRLIAQAKGIAA